MPLNFSSLKKPVNDQVIDPATGVLRQEWQLYFKQLTEQLNGAVGELGAGTAPTDGEYIVGAANATLSAERVATDTTTIDADMGTAGQAKWNVLEVPGIGGNGLVARTAAATYAARTLTPPAAGIGVTNGDGVAGNPTLSLANDLAALEGLGSTGFAARTASDTWAQRSIEALSGIVVTNPAGVAGNPSLAATIKRRSITDITSGGTITPADRSVRVRILTGTGTLAFDPLATLTDGFWCIIHNAGTGNVTLNPDGAETIDGLTSWVLYPGGMIIVQVTAADITSFLLAPMQVTFDSSGTFTKPGCGTFCEGEIWGGGASGGKGTTNLAAGGGGGGACVPFKFPLSAIGTTETVTIASGGNSQTTASTNGNVGGNSTFGALVTGYGGGGGSAAANGRGGGGGGALSAGTATGVGGQPFLTLADGAFSPTTNGVGLGGGSAPQLAGASANGSGWGGAAGGAGDAATGGAGGSSVWGGAGGGGGGDTTAGGAGGTSVFGGAGGAGATDAANGTGGTQPGGGGGGTENGNSGAGGNGRLRIRIY